MYWFSKNSQEYLSLKYLAIMLADVTNMSLLKKKVRFFIFYLTVLNTFVSCIFTACRQKVGFSGHTRKAILSDITLYLCFARRRLIPPVSKFSIFQPLFVISSHALTMSSRKLRILINLSLFDKCLASSHKLKLSVRIIISFPRNVVFLFNLLHFSSHSETS